MARIIVVGSFPASQKYVDSFIDERKLKSYEVEKFEGKIKIEDARKIVKSLSLKIQGQKLITLTGELTPESQNALLKCIEEAGENVHFIFCVASYDHLLPTIQSRCTAIKLDRGFEVDQKLLEYVVSLKVKNSWDQIDLVADYIKENGIEPLVPVLRQLFLESKSYEEKVSYYNYCKKLLPSIPLSNLNNVNSRLIVETIFLNSAS